MFDGGNTIPCQVKEAVRSLKTRGTASFPTPFIKNLNQPIRLKHPRPKNGPCRLPSVRTPAASWRCQLRGRRDSVPKPPKLMLRNLEVKHKLGVKFSAEEAGPQQEPGAAFDRLHDRELDLPSTVLETVCQAPT